MANISKVNFNGNNLDVKDTYAREQIQHLTADNYTADVTGDYTVNAGDISTSSANTTMHTTADRTIDTDGNDSVHIDGASTLNVGGLRTETFAGDKTEIVTGTQTEKAGNRSTTVTGKWMVNTPSKSFSMADVATGADVTNAVNAEADARTRADSELAKQIGVSNTYINVKQLGCKGDGVTDDTKTLENIMKSYRALYFPKGTYIINSARIPSNTTLFSNGDAVLKTDTANNILINATDNSGEYDGAENITIDGLAFTAPLPDVCTMIAFGHSKNIKVTNCHFTYSNGWHMIELNAVANSTISSCTFDNYGVENSNYTEMVQLDAMTDNSVFPWFGPYDNTPCNNIKIESCEFIGNGVKNDLNPAGIGNHSSTVNANTTTITLCTFTELGSGIKFVASEGTLITNNRFSGCNYGISLTNLSTNATIASNTFNCNTGINTTANRSLIMNNKISGEYGIVGHCELTSFVSNTCTCSTTGIMLKGGTLFGCNIMDCICFQGTRDVEIDNSIGSEDFYISNNKISAFYYTGRSNASVICNNSFKNVCVISGNVSIYNNRMPNNAFPASIISKITNDDLTVSPRTWTTLATVHIPSRGFYMIDLCVSSVTAKNISGSLQMNYNGQREINYRTGFNYINTDAHRGYIRSLFPVFATEETDATIQIWPTESLDLTFNDGNTWLYKIA